MTDHTTILGATALDVLESAIRAEHPDAVAMETVAITQILLPDGRVLVWQHTNGPLEATRGVLASTVRIMAAKDGAA